MELPHINMELRGMQQIIKLAFMDHFDEIKAYAKKNIDASINAFREWGLQHAIGSIVEKTMSEAIDETIGEAVEVAVREYFTSGVGKDFIAEAIISKITKE